MIDIPVKKLVDNAVIPTRSHHNDAGFDFTATSKKTTSQYTQYGTGIAMAIPDGYVGLIFPRSSVTKKDLMLKNAVVVIDSGYRGEIMFRFWISGKTGEIKQGIGVGDYYVEENVYDIDDRIGQMIIFKLPEVKLKEVDDLEDSERGTGGYGSTNKVVIPEVSIDKLKKLNEGT